MEVAEAVVGRYCRLQMPLKLALTVRGTVAGHRLGALEGGEPPPPLPMHPWHRGMPYYFVEGDPPPTCVYSKFKMLRMTQGIQKCPQNTKQIPPPPLPTPRVLVSGAERNVPPSAVLPRVLHVRG